MILLPSCDRSATPGLAWLPPRWSPDISGRFRALGVGVWFLGSGKVGQLVPYVCAFLQVLTCKSTKTELYRRCLEIARSTVVCFLFFVSLSCSSSFGFVGFCVCFVF